MCASGHGYPFIPGKEYDDLDLVLKDADAWVGLSCTIGGQAIVYDKQDRVVYDHSGRRITSGFTLPPLLCSLD
jgi:hypothetical protein